MVKFKNSLFVTILVSTITISHINAMEIDPFKEFMSMKSEHIPTENEVLECRNLFKIFLNSEEAEFVLNEMKKFNIDTISKLFSNRPEIILELMIFSILLKYLKIQDFKQLISKNVSEIQATLSNLLHHNFITNPQEFKSLLHRLVRNVNYIELANDTYSTLLQTRQDCLKLQQAIHVFQVQLRQLFVILSYLLKSKTIFENICNFLNQQYPKSADDIEKFSQMLHNEVFSPFAWEKYDLSTVLNSVWS